MLIAEPDETLMAVQKEGKGRPRFMQINKKKSTMDNYPGGNRPCREIRWRTSGRVMKSVTGSVEW
jgi:hypothetical protein